MPSLPVGRSRCGGRTARRPGRHFIVEGFAIIEEVRGCPGTRPNLSLQDRQARVTGYAREGGDMKRFLIGLMVAAVAGMWVSWVGGFSPAPGGVPGPGTRP